MTILEKLPGIMMPVAEVNRQLGKMWHSEKEGSATPSEFRASQMNLILHFGMQTNPEDAEARFQEAISFSQRYPSRILVLCPENKHAGERFLEAKLFALCYIGDTPRSMCCCEALMLGYPPNEKGDLENQISIWLENDLPTCHWFHRVPAERVRSHYLSFTRGMKRVLFDSSTEGPGYSQIPWNEPKRVRDLADARILPIRQSIGQYLSGFSPSELIDGVRSLELKHSPGLVGETHCLANWMKGCLVDAGANPSPDISIEALTDSSKTQCIEGKWEIHDSNNQFSFSFQLGDSQGKLEASFGAMKPESYPIECHLLAPHEALSEAIFF